MKLIITLGIIGFIVIYLILVPYLLWTAPHMEEDDYEQKDIDNLYGVAHDDADDDTGEH